MFHPNPFCLLSTCLPAVLNSCIVDRMVSARVTTAIYPPLLREVGMRGAGQQTDGRGTSESKGERRRVSRPSGRGLAVTTRSRTERDKERSSVSIMLEIKGRLVLPAALLFISSPVSGWERGRAAACINENAGNSPIHHPSV